MSTPREASSNESSKVDAGVAGAGVGTLLVSLANNLPNDNTLKPLLILIAPAT